MTAAAAVARAEVLVALDVHKWLGRNHVLRGIDLTVFEREIVCLLGPSGSGKSTLLRCINHLETVDAGSISVCGELVGYMERRGELYEQGVHAVAVARRRVGMVFQQFNLFSHMTAVQNVTYGPIHVLGQRKRYAVERGMELLSQVGLADKASSLPSQLSGGQQQRIAIARALAMEPQLMLFDEPTSALDPELVDDVLGVMIQVAGSGMTMIVVTHEVAFARQVAHRVVFMDEGAVIEAGAAEQVLDRPRLERTAAFLGRVRHPIRS